MNEKNIFIKILKLDKNIYFDLINNQSSIQKGVAIYLATTILSTLGIGKLFQSTVDFLNANVALISQDLPNQEMSLIRQLIVEFELLSSQYNETSTLITTLLNSIISGLLVTAVMFVLLKYLFRKLPKYSEVLIIFCFSSVPSFLFGISLFSNSFLIQFLLLLIVGVYGLATLGSGLKQVYSLRSIEVLLLLVSVFFGSSIASSVFI
ncbi:MAG: YIP1 family protein [Actinomycetota bacterium]|nr:YIP1 family protein [Actinomycetota bacterium]MDA3013056.1 YIP1 family protein [Actinomycetota bacterium]